MDRRVFYLGLTRLIRASGRVSSFIFLPLIFVFIYHISFIETGIVLGVAILLMSAIQYYSGILTDRIGRRVFLILIPIPAGLLYISMYFTVLYRLPVMLLIGLFYSTIAINALQYPAIQASIADVTSLKQRLSGYTEIRVMANAGAAIGPILGAILSVYGFQYIFLMAGIATFIEIIILYFNVKETYFPSKIEYLTKNDIKLAYKDRFFILFIIIGIIMAFVLRQRGASLTLYAFDFEGLPILYLAYIYSLNGILVVLLQYPIFKLMNRETRPVLFRSVGMLFYFLGFIVLMFSKNIDYFLLSMGIMTVGEDFVAPTTQTIITSIAPNNMKGTYIGIYNLFISFGSFSGSIVGLYMLSYYESATATFWLLIAMSSLVVSVLYLAINNAFLKRMNLSIKKKISSYKKTSGQ
ncbi:MFS transporter [Ferroplasma acidiphilum]|uniref:Major facilitator superfamily permease n=3 Tax=Ferroplasma acidiphilum TaxID=74969 RepID=A0A1V0N5D0_9ARCH|nr:MFS transporter [Ferroplasma acidiphilum]ARD85342.1 major facilitator superfamily permease [Ferroplasma acidiphilum]MCL4348938.1 MFS transporter [Candidatus Thermoplasmatota archaeon]